MDMWFGDTLIALDAIRQYQKDENFCIKSVMPAVDGVVVETTHFTFIKYFYEDGHIEEHPKVIGGRNKNENYT